MKPRLSIRRSADFGGVRVLGFEGFAGKGIAGLWMRDYWSFWGGGDLRCYCPFWH